MPLDIHIFPPSAKRIVPLFPLLFVPFLLFLMVSVSDSDSDEPSSASDEETTLKTVKMAQAGDEASFTTLYNSYYTEINRYLIRLVGNHEDAADLAAVTFTRTWRQLPGLHEGRHFRGWLYSIATNAAFDHLRSKKKRHFLWGNSVDETIEEGAARFEDRVEVEEIVRHALKRVAPKPRACLVLYLEGFSRADIALFLGLHEKSVGTYLSTARTQFYQAYHQLRNT
jgi:RNA polymerase sigma-70 factor, ECF subfamily